jgi:type II secretory pathway component PulF
MPNFKYSVRDKYGRPLSGVMNAQDKDAVALYLKNSGFAPIAIEESRQTFSASKDFFARFMKVKPEALVMFTRQLVTLQSAGMPILMSLGAIREQTESKLLKDTLAKVVADIEGGSNFSDALGRHPNIFDELYVNMVKAGEASGTLDSVLERLASLGEYQMQIKSKIRSATMYPVIVVITLVVAFIVVVTFVLPKFGEVFERFGVALPLPTRILLGINYTIRHWWYLILLGLVGLVFLLKRYIDTKEGRALWDGFKLNMPIFGILFLKITMSRFARISSALIKSGIPLLQVLEMSARTTGNVIVSRSLETIRKSVNEGKPMHEAMKADKLFPPIVTQMVTIGESTGRLEDLLERISLYYDEQVDHSLKNLTTAIEPILIFCLGGMVLAMALGIFLPLWNMMSVFRR